MKAKAKAKAKKISYTPYFWGSVVGISLFLSVMLLGEYFGSTTSIVRISSLVLKGIGFDVDHILFFAKKDGAFSYHKLVSFQLMFLLGVLIGGFASAMISKEFKVSIVPGLFKKKFGNSKGLRFDFAFFGGCLMIIGARIAHGCASWWGLSVSSRLDLTGFATVVCFFTGAVVTNFLAIKVFKFKESKK